MRSQNFKELNVMVSFTLKQRKWGGKKIRGFETLASKTFDGT
jgi:hypothetical protein